MNVKFSRWILMASIGVLAVAAAPAYSQDSAALGGYKIGVVNRAKVFAEYQMMKDSQAEIEKKHEQQQQILDEMIEKLKVDSKAKGDAKDAGKLSQAEVQAWEAEFTRRRNELQSKKDDFQLELDQMTSSSLRQIAEAMQAEIDTIAEKDGYHLILEADDNPSANSPVVFYQKSMDITSAVVTNLNAKYKKSASNAGDSTTKTAKSKG